ncbi:MAG: hypothetical protein COA82_13385 [Alkaliphilus sp.]|jgi:hypothetical protein|nr:hypothetical protein [bacterium AH-315-E09]PHS28610.1 MAG: hypothetical protein COA82_13385 [Alkaliphilus sp.]
MLLIEKALALYTDKLNANEKIDLSYFEKQLSATDYEEFLELIEFVKLGKSVKVTKDFDRTFAEIDEYRKEYYASDFSKASCFRTEKDAKRKEANDKLNEIFKEEFGDEN